MKLTKRDILFFILGVFTFFTFDIMYNWEDSKASAIKGWNDGAYPQETTP